MNNIKKYLTSNLITAVIRVCILVVFTVCVYFGTTIKKDSDDNGNANESLTKVLRLGIKTVSNNMIFISENEVAEEPEEIDEEKQKLIDKYQAWLDEPENQVLLTDIFSSPDEVDWNNVLYKAAMNGYIGTNLNDEPSEMEDEFLELYFSNYYGNVVILTDEEINTYMKDKVGQTCDFKGDTDEDDLYRDWFRPRKGNYWYCEGWASKEKLEFACVDVVEDQEKVVLYVKSYEYTNNHETLSEIHLKKDNDKYIVLSNEIHWDEGAISIFPIDLSEFDGDTYVYIYDDARVIDRQTHEPTGEYELSAIIINNNEYKDHLYLQPDKDDERGKLIAINEVMAADYDMDEVTDIIVTGECEKGYYANVFYWKDGDIYNSFYIRYNLPDFVCRELSEPSAQEILDYLTDGHGEEGFSDYKEAFIIVARNYCASATNGTLEESRASFSLVYFDEDDIPELVAGVNGYDVSVYQFNEGHVYPIIDNWPYGAGGNSGYDYYEKTGIIANFNQDGAGASYYWTYLKLNEETHQMETVLYYHGVNDTSGGWGEPGYYKCQGDKTTEIQEWEYDSLLNSYLKSSKESDYLIGAMNYSELIEALDNGNYGYNDYRDAYIAEVERYSKKYGDSARFSLVYIWGDSIPQLLAEVPGKEFSLYEVSNGSSVAILKDISYDLFEGDHLEYIYPSNYIRGQILNDNKGSWESYYYHIIYYKKVIEPDIYISVQLDDNGEYIHSYKEYDSDNSVFNDCTETEYSIIWLYNLLKDDETEFIPFEGTSTAEEMSEQLEH